MSGNASDSSSDGSEMELPAKKQKLEPTSFTEQNSTDEICLQFDDGRKLYVHPVFLFLISPVFKAMFDHDCVEKKTNTITLQEKKVEDFLEFLMCLHPAHLRRVENSNVLLIVRFASEYQVSSIESKCKAVMGRWLSKCVENSMNFFTPDIDCLKNLKTCLVILDIVDELDYLDLKQKAIATVARFNTGLYTDQRLRFPYVPQSDEWDELRNECTAMFDEMPDRCKTMVFFERLKHVETHEFFRYDV